MNTKISSTSADYIEHDHRFLRNSTIYVLQFLLFSFEKLSMQYMRDADDINSSNLLIHLSIELSLQ